MDRNVEEVGISFGLNSGWFDSGGFFVESGVTRFPSLASQALISILIVSSKTLIFQISSLVFRAICKRTLSGSFDITIGISQLPHCSADTPRDFDPLT